MPALLAPVLVVAAAAGSAACTTPAVESESRSAPRRRRAFRDMKMTSLNLTSDTTSVLDIGNK